MGDSLYSSSFEPSLTSEKVLVDGKILGEGETAKQMIERVVTTLALAEVNHFGTDIDEARVLANEFGKLMDERKIVMSTPVLTNAGRYADKPLSACTVPPVDLRGDLARVRKTIDQMHSEGMGTGFNFSDLEDPVAMLEYLNKVAIEGASSGREDRPVGNMGILSVHHPKIIDFVLRKKDAHRNGEIWKFNISVDITDDFIRAYKDGADYALSDGTLMNAKSVMDAIALSAHESGDPGLIFLDRLNMDNPTPGVGLYTSTAPCAEVGLAPGESCQFGYINLGAYILENGEIDTAALTSTVHLMTRMLDNALQISIKNYELTENQLVMERKRKIGIGVCGVADMLIKSGMPYASEEGRTLVRDILALINYESKVASHELAKVRGSFLAMMDLFGCRYNDPNGFIEQKYGDSDTKYVSSKQWRDLGGVIRETKLLRNASTIALPPTGRSGMVIDASTGIEPHFRLPETVLANLMQSLINDGITDSAPIIQTAMTEGTINSMTDVPSHIQAVFATAIHIAPEDHLKMVGAVRPVIDEAVSKTINLPNETTRDQIVAMYLAAYEMGLKGITVFRDGCISYQPKEVK
jgi:ribonucleoside-diphosphate reductase alpha chain